jgi:hypothetical protein
MGHDYDHSVYVVNDELAVQHSAELEAKLDRIIALLEQLVNRPSLEDANDE